MNKSNAKNRSAARTAEATALVPASGALVAMPAPGANLDRADRVNFFHRLSREAGIVAIRAAIAAGVELLEAKAEHAGGFQSWVKSKCSFGLSTAYNYMAVAEKTLTEARLPALLEGTDADRENAIEEAATSTDSRTLTDLYEGLGIVKRTPSKMGGVRPGAGRPPKSEELLQLKIDAWADRFVDENSEAVFDSQWHLRLDPERRTRVLEVAKRIAEDLG